MSLKAKISIAIALFFWASAFAGIRAGLVDYSPEGLALLRYLVASTCLTLMYLVRPIRNPVRLRDLILLLGVGALGIGIYNVTLNHAELTISSGMASFIISQAPIFTAIMAIIFLGEPFNAWRGIGFLVSICGVALITIGEKHGFHWDMSIAYILVAVVASGSYSLLQKPFLKKYNAIESTTYVIWGGTIFLAFYFPKLQVDFVAASWSTTLIVIYLGIFPAALGYVAWSYALAEIPASRAMSFLYFTPFIATLLGWFFLDEIPTMLSLAGCLLAIFGVWLVNQSYAKPKISVPNT